MEQKLFTSLSLDELDALIQNSILKVIKNQLPQQSEGIRPTNCMFFLTDCHSTFV